MGWLNSKNVLFLLILIVTVFVFYGELPNVLNWDVFGHYIYLPLIFENHSLIISDLKYVEEINNTYQVSPVLYQFVQGENGNFFTKYACGWALLQFPFYLLAELWANFGGYKPDGFSMPYQVMMVVGFWFYSMLGLVFTRRVLLNFFSDKMTLVLLLLMVFSTNLFYMFYGALAQSHLFAFFLFALLIDRILFLQKSNSISSIIILGAVWAILTLVRPPDGILGLLIFFWNINSVDSFKSRINWFFCQNRKKTLILMTTFLILLLPQFIYWYLNSGNIIVNSYANNNGEGFDFADPYLFEFLFSFKKGWLLYTPVMIFAFAGVWFMIRESAQGVAFSFVFLLFLYVIASWTCWWYGASYSSRAAIDIYPLLIVLIGYAVVGLWKKRTKWVLISVLSFLTLLNLIQTYQVTKGILNHSFMTREYYLSVFLQFNYPSKEQEKLLGFDIEKMYQEGFSQNKKNYRMIAVYNDQFDKPQKIKSGNEYATELFLPVYKYKKKSHLWLKVSWQYQGEISSLNDVLFYTSTLYNNNNYGWSGYRALGNDVEVDSTNKIISFYYLTPNIRSVYDRFMFGAMNLSENESILIGREIQFFEPIIDY